MKIRRGNINYVLDFLYGSTRFPSGWLMPHVVHGHFIFNNQRYLQKILFDTLFKKGFKRTFWQLIYPGQTAGLVLKTGKDKFGVKEYHVRFYKDGTIDCELEYSRFNDWHWNGKRKHSISVLENIVDEHIKINPYVKYCIKKLFKPRYYSEKCSRK